MAASKSPRHQFAMVFDLNKCLGCQCCTVGCKTQWTQATGMEAMRKLVYAFYTPDFSFANFVRSHPEHRDRLVDLLTGNVFKKGVTDIFEDMKGFIELPEAIPLESA